VIYRGFVGKEFPPFVVEISQEFSRVLTLLLRTSPPFECPSWPPPSNWPAFLTFHGTACLMTIWEELGVDPLELRLVREEFRHMLAPVAGEPLNGRVCVEDVSEHIDPNVGIEEQVDLAVYFRDLRGSDVAEYRCSFRVPVARSVPACGRIF
jgi:hypothetical protein